ncbi:RNA-binding S4 domain-containing protein [Clostridium sp. D2Q-11]|uniref:RQC P-site tRNA stabilizing factor n=1 Tax=Anaeromonas frigoriresistens TaxID=2683708 RepID=A0A942UWA7_9FIRM|nr:RNA-binding S4 domain-containing protein [Anaeromonas frigoriresistens]MBS4537586.1 RNA-binding S4 domain-containing protein [Anaeromonas frigoriresistens]
MRVDKFLKNSRIIKRRTVAKEACDTGRVFVNDKEAKAGTEVIEGDKVEINFGNNTMKIEVLELLEHAPKDKSQEMYKVIT